MVKIRRLDTHEMKVSRMEAWTSCLSRKNVPVSHSSRESNGSVRTLCYGCKSIGCECNTAHGHDSLGPAVGNVALTNCIGLIQKHTKGERERFLLWQNKTGCEFSRKCSFSKLRAIQNSHPVLFRPIKKRCFFFKTFCVLLDLFQNAGSQLCFRFSLSLSLSL